MRKWWHFLWILWLVLGIANLLFINVYTNHFGSPDLSLIQQMGYLLLTLVLLLFVGLWWIFVGNSRGSRGLTVFGAIVAILFGLAGVGLVVYTLALGGEYVQIIVPKLAGWFSFLSF